MPHNHPTVRRWVMFGGFCLAAIAGFVNVVMLDVYHVPVSHMTGGLSRLSMDAAEIGREQTTGLTISLVAAFAFGAIISGAIIGGPMLRPGRRYGVVLMIAGAALAVATVLAMRDKRAAVPFAAMACGLQNAMASSYYGLILRTTHVTGIVTDIGVMLGQRLRGHRIEPWRLGLLTLLLTGFFGGGALGAVTVHRVGLAGLGFAAAACFLGGAGYWTFRHLRGFEAIIPAAPHAAEKHGAERVA